MILGTTVVAGGPPMKPGRWDVGGFSRSRQLEDVKAESHEQADKRYADIT